MNDVGITDFQTLFDDMLKQQFMQSLPSEVKAYVMHKQCKTAQQSAEAADLSFQIDIVKREDGIMQHFDQVHSHQNVYRPPSYHPQSQTRGPNGFQPSYQGNYRAPSVYGRGGAIAQRGATQPRNPYTARNMPVTVFSKPIQRVDFHDCDLMCDCQMSHNASANEIRQTLENNTYIFPIFVNGKRTSAIRYIGNFKMTLISDEIVSPSECVDSKYVKIHGCADKKHSCRQCCYKIATFSL